MALSNKLLFVKIFSASEGWKIPFERGILPNKANFHILLYCKVACVDVATFLQFHSPNHIEHTPLAKF